MEKKYIEFARKFFLGTACSRVLGLVRDLLLAFYFGASLAHFFVAFRLVYLFRRLFGEGAIQPGFIPHFQQMRKEGKSAYLFFRDSFYSLAIPILSLIAILELLLWPMRESSFIFLVMLLVPSVFFLFLFVLASSFLQTHNQYFLASSMPALANLVWIFSIFFAANHTLVQAEKILAVGVLLGFVLQGVIPFLRAFFISPLTLQEWKSIRFFPSECRALFLSIFWLALGVGVSQINSAIDSFFALTAHPQGASYLWFAIRLQQLPLALFGIAFSGAILPSLSSFASRKNGKEIDLLISRSSLHLLALILPTVFLMSLVAPHLITLFFGRGAFTSFDLMQTTKALHAYLIGLLPMSLSLIFSAALFAKKQFRTSAFISLFSVGMNVVCNSLFLFIFHWGVMSIALATSLSAFFQLFILWIAQKELSSWIKEYKEMGKIIFSALFSYWVTSIFVGNEMGMEDMKKLGSLSLLIKISIPACMYIVSYGVCCKTLKANSLLELFGKITSYEPKTHKQEQRL